MAGLVTWYFGAPRPGRNGLNSEKNQLSAETKRVLDAGETFVLFSLDPTPPQVRLEFGPPADETFHEFEVLGKAEIQDVKIRSELLTAIYDGIGAAGAPAACFNPRHGIRVTLGDETVDLVICFECRIIQIYSSLEEVVLTNESPKQTFDRALKRANLPLPKD